MQYFSYDYEQQKETRQEKIKINKIEQVLNRSIHCTLIENNLWK